MISQAHSASLGLTHVATYYMPGMAGSVESVHFNDVDNDGSSEILACDGETLVLYSPKTDIIHLEKPLDSRSIDYDLVFDDINRDFLPDIVIGYYFEAGEFGPDTVCLLEFYDGAAGYTESDSFFFEAQIEQPVFKSSPFSSVDLRCADVDDDTHHDLLFSYDRYRISSFGIFDIQTTMGQTSLFTDFPNSADWNRTALLSFIAPVGTYNNEGILVGTRYSTFSRIPGDVDAVGWVEFISSGGDSVASIGQTMTGQCVGDSSVRFSSMEVMSVGDIHPLSDDRDIVVRCHWSQTCYTDNAVSFDSSIVTTRLYRIHSLDEIDLLWSDLDPEVINNTHYLPNFSGYFFGAKGGVVYKLSGLNGETELESEPLDVDTILWCSESSHSGGDFVAVKNQTLDVHTVDIGTDAGQLDIEPTLPQSFHLGHPYPNPFNPSCEIQYSLPSQTHVTMDIYNILGRKVTTLVDGVQSAGRHTITWDGNDNDGNPVASGIYLYRMEAGEFVGARKMVLLK